VVILPPENRREATPGSEIQERMAVIMNIIVYEEVCVIFYFMKDN
jgi:hypothetical protein